MLVSKLSLTRPLVLAGLLVLGGCAAGRSTSAHAPRTLSFELPDLDGRVVKSADHAGQVVLVDVWATWCKPCEHSMPFYAGLVERYGARGFEVLAVSVDEQDDPVRAFLARHPLPFPVLRDPAGKIPQSIDAAMETMPTAILLGADGQVRLVHAGFVDADKPVLEAAIAEAVADREAKKPSP